MGRHVTERGAPHAYAVPPGALHVHPANAGAADLHVRQSIRPQPRNTELVRGVERYFETLFALAQRGKVSRGGWILDPLQSALTLDELLLPFSYLAWVPQGAQRATLAGLAALARRLGYSAYVEPEWGDEPAGGLDEVVGLV